MSKTTRRTMIEGLLCEGYSLRELEFYTEDEILQAYLDIADPTTLDDENPYRVVERQNCAGLSFNF